MLSVCFLKCFAGTKSTYAFWFIFQLFCFNIDFMYVYVFLISFLFSFSFLHSLRIVFQHSCFCRECYNFMYLKNTFKVLCQGFALFQWLLAFLENIHSFMIPFYGRKSKDRKPQSRLWIFMSWPFYRNMSKYSCIRRMYAIAI